MSDPGAADDRAHIEDQIHVYEALVTAVARRREVYDLLEEAEDPVAASRDLQTLLGTDEVGAQAVIDLQLRRLTATERATMAEKLRDLKHYLSTLG
jgi:DNA gyrase subunit A